MNRVCIARRVGAALFGGALVLGVACSSEEEPSPPADFCGAAAAAAKSCANPSSCDDALAESCTSLGEVLEPAALDAALVCLQSGTCGTQTCLSRGQRTVLAGKAHRDLADRFCKTCAPQVDDCATQFYAKKGLFAGGLVLPFSEKIASAVSKSCTADSDTCGSTFATCASETIAREVRGVLESKVAECIIGGSRRDEDDEEPEDREGGTDPTPTCTPESCPTGCCRDDKCEPGTADTACGAGGGACSACVGSQKCAAGTCEDKCGPGNCTGCCDGDTCVPGTANDRCGAGGEACRACATNGPAFACTNNKCVDPVCQASCATGCCTADGCKPGTTDTACGTGGAACVACAYGRMCEGTTKSCVFDSNAVWDFNVGFASIPEKNTAGVSWDGNNGLADPYLIAFSGLGAASHIGKTATHDNTHLPFWDEAPLKKIKASELLDNVAVEVWDEDFSDDDLIGGCKLPISPTFFDGTLHAYTCPGTTTTVPVELFFRIRKPL